MSPNDPLSASFLPPIGLDRRSQIPMYRQLYDWFRKAIIEGQMRPGQRVPSTRGLASELTISRIPVLHAYEQLLAEGYFETFVGAGTCVAGSIPDDTLNLSAARRAPQETAHKPGARGISRRGAGFMGTPEQPWLNVSGAFRVSLPALDHFPIAYGRSWWPAILDGRRGASWPMAMLWDICRFAKPSQNIWAHPAAVRCEPSQILVTTGSQLALQLSAQVLLDPDDRVWMEEPGYPGARQAFVTAGAQLLPAPVDHEGMNVGDIIRRDRGARAVYVTPSHQYPLGTTMSAARRMLLLNWASALWCMDH